MYNILGILNFIYLPQTIQNTCFIFNFLKSILRCFNIILSLILYLLGENKIRSGVLAHFTTWEIFELSSISTF